MLATFQSLARLATNDFADLVTRVEWIGGTPSDPNKMRLHLQDGSFLDAWLSTDGDYAYHWERRRQRGKIYRWDNAPHHPEVNTFPDHLHAGDEQTILASQLSSIPETALRQVLEYLRANWAV